LPFHPRDPDFERRVRASFARQAAMHTLGVTLERVAPGEVDLAIPFRDDLTQQHGFLHAGVVTAAVDSACGYAALSLMEPGAAVLSVEFKVQLLAPARGARWATVGGSLVWLGAAMYGVGIGGWATVYYFATDPAALDPATAAGLIDHVNDDTARILAVPIGGALLVALGSMLLAVALWRARTVPRWVPIVAGLSGVTGIVLPPDTVAGIVAETASSVTSIAIGWYAWQRHAIAGRDPGDALAG